MNTTLRNHSKLTRRGFIGAALAAPTLAFAHVGHGAADVVADAVVLDQTERQLRLKLVIYNLGEAALTLFGVIAPGAAPIEALFVSVPIAERTEVEVTLNFEAAVPGIFTAVLDFESEGQGPVLVMP